MYSGDGLGKICIVPFSRLMSLTADVTSQSQFEAEPVSEKFSKIPLFKPSSSIKVVTEVLSPPPIP